MKVYKEIVKKCVEYKKISSVIEFESNEHKKFLINIKNKIEIILKIFFRINV